MARTKRLEPAVIRILALVVPIAAIFAEILVFIAVGSQIGVLPTVLLALATSVLGVVLVRRQGLSALRQVRADLDGRRVPAAAIGQAVVVAIGGLLLVLPGFISDTVGLFLFIPGVRGAMWRAIRGSVKVEGGATAGPRPYAGRSRSRPGVIDLEATEVRSGPRRSDGSPWRKDDA